MCEFCKNWKTQETVYQKGPYCDLMIGSSLFCPALFVDNIHKGCPQFVECSAKSKSMMVAFQINYCPECGKKLTDEK
jgi:hypothetical protein